MQLRDHYAKIQAAGGDVLVVMPLGGEPLAHFMVETKLTFPVLVDPQRQVYRAYGLERGLAINLDSVIKFIRLLWQEGWFYIPLSDPLQIGGDFVIGSNGQICFAHTSANPLDRPPIKELLEVIKNIN